MITSPKNNRIKEAQKLHRRRNRYKSGRLILEGARLIEDALSTGAKPDVLFFASEEYASNAKVNGLIQQAESLGIECLACTGEVFTVLSETVTPQGVAAVFPLPSLAPPPHLTLSLILDQVRDPGNAGTLLRSAEAAGVDQVLFAPGTVDPFNEKVLRAAMGAHFRLSLRVCDTWSVVHECLGSEHNIYVAEAKATLSYDQVDWNQPSTLIVGGEADGPSSKTPLHPTPISIPMLGQTESLNAGVSGAVVLFEAARQRRKR